MKPDAVKPMHWFPSPHREAARLLHAKLIPVYSARCSGGYLLRECPPSMDVGFHMLPRFRWRVWHVYPHTFCLRTAARVKLAQAPPGCIVYYKPTM